MRIETEAGTSSGLTTCSVVEPAGSVVDASAALAGGTDSEVS